MYVHTHTTHMGRRRGGYLYSVMVGRNVRGEKNCNNDDKIRCHAHAERGGRRRLDALTAGTRNDNIIIGTYHYCYLLLHILLLF